MTTESDCEKQRLSFADAACVRMLGASEHKLVCAMAESPGSLMLQSISKPSVLRARAIVA